MIHAPKTDTPIEAEYIGPNLKNAVKMTPRKFASSVLEVFEKLGGASWLLIQAKADPKSFLDLLKKMIPKNVQLDNLSGFTINLIDQFGNKVQIDLDNEVTTPNPATCSALQESGQPSKGIATGGSPPLDLSSSTSQEDIHIDLKDTFPDSGATGPIME